MGLTTKQKRERAAVRDGTHEWAEDAFGNKYLNALPEKEQERVCVHCGGKVVEIQGTAIMPGDVPPFKHAVGVGATCPKRYGPLAASDVRDL